MSRHDGIKIDLCHGLGIPVIILVNAADKSRRFLAIHRVIHGFAHMSRAVMDRISDAAVISVIGQR